MKLSPNHKPVWEEDHYSPSSLNTYQDCPRKLHYRKVLGIPELMNENLILGSAVDKALERHFQSRMGQEVEATPHEIFRWSVQNSLKHHKDELGEEGVEKVLEGRERLSVALEQYLQEVAPYVEPVETQKKISVTLKGIKTPIIGYIDLLAKVDGKLTVIDFKTSGRKSYSPYQSQINQLGIYALAVMKENGLEEPPPARLDFLIKTKNPAVHLLDVPLDLDTLSTIILGFKQMDEGIRGDKWPMNRGSMLCSKQFCSYYSECHRSTRKSSVKALVNSITLNSKENV